ncbi:MAG TPA: anti-sigma factor [Candidatus Acidoferrales bacterium]|nr:anti-sigma factor [Candidatus Acidoferrales bacterium]
MNHVTDELELYALGALAGEERARVAAHLAQCPACREQAKVLEDVAVALPDTLTPRDAPARLRARILATARGGVAAQRVSRGTAWTAWLRPSRAALIALSLAVLVLGAIDVALVQQSAALAQQRDVAAAQRDEFSVGLYRVAHGGHTWYMAGLDQWAGSGGTLFSPAKPDAAPFVVFHDLRPLAAGSVYALWLVDDAGHWTRVANFTPNGGGAQTVVLDEPVAGYTQCALTIESWPSGKRSGPLVMQSRIT